MKLRGLGSKGQQVKMEFSETLNFQRLQKLCDIAYYDHLPMHDTFVMPLYATHLVLEIQDAARQDQYWVRIE